MGVLAKRAYKPRRRFGLGLTNLTIVSTKKKCYATAYCVYGQSVKEIIDGIPNNTGYLRFNEFDFSTLCACGLLPTPANPYFTNTDILPLCPYNSIQLVNRSIRKLVGLGLINIFSASGRDKPCWYELSKDGYTMLYSFKKVMEARILKLDTWLADR